MCAQAVPYWPKIASYFLGGSDAATLAYVNSQVDAVASAMTIDSLAAPDPRQSEDCLFLDVIVPESIYASNKSAPVLVWVYGGGYVYGDKTSTGNPATLIAQSQVDEGEGVVYVAMNYRLGLFGWLSGSIFSSKMVFPTQHCTISDSLSNGSSRIFISSAETLLESQ